MAERSRLGRAVPVFVTGGLLVLAALVVNGNGGEGRVALIPLIGFLPLLAVVAIWGARDGVAEAGERARAKAPRVPARVRAEMPPAPAEGPPAEPERPAVPAPAPGKAPPDAAPERKPPRFVATETSSVYHVPDCPHAQKIGEEARVEFASAAAAEKSGRRPCSRCCGG